MENAIYNANIEIIKNRFEDVYNYLKNDRELQRDNSEIEADVIDVDGAKRLVAINNNQYIQLESLYNNSVIVEKYFESISDDWELDGKYFMFGLGNGMYARYFLENTSDDHLICVIEPSVKILRSVLENYNLCDLLENERFIFTVILGDDGSKYKGFFDSIVKYTDIFTFKYGVHPNYDYLFSDALLLWDKMFVGRFSNIKSTNQLYIEHGLDFIKNNYTFFPYVEKTRSLAKLRELIPENIPMIIVSAGPSLVKNMNEIKKAKGKALIIAVDAAVNPLMKNGIVPDINICVDPSKGEEYIEAEGAEYIPLCCGMNAGRGLVSAHKGEKLLFSDNNDYLIDFFRENGIEVVALSTGGSVSTNAYSLARYLKTDRIILVGQDLAFTNDESHAKGSVRGSETLEDVKSILADDEDIDIYGNPVKTSGLFIHFKNWFESQIKLFPEIRLIDATEGGALIEGSEIMTLSEAIEKECTEEFDFGKLLDKVPFLLNRKQADTFNEYVYSLPNKLDKILEEINMGLKSYSKINSLAVENKIYSNEIKKESKKSNEILTSIQENPATEYVRFLIQEYTDKMLKTINKTQNDVRKELIEISEIGTEYLKELKKSILTIKEEIEKFEIK